MKTWFVYFINEQKIGTWANNNAEAERNLRKEYGDVPMKFIGVNYGKEFGVQPDKVTFSGMSATDMMIATGNLNMLVGLRYGR